MEKTVPQFISDCCSAMVVEIYKDIATCTGCKEQCQVIDTDN